MVELWSLPLKQDEGQYCSVETNSWTQDRSMKKTYEKETVIYPVLLVP